MEHFTICPHCRNKHLHYPFCQDLGTKSIIDIPWPENINFALFKVKQKMDTGGGRTIPDTEIFIPGFYEVQKVGQDFWSVLTEKEYQTFIAPADYYADRNLFYVREKQVKVPVPEEIWNQQPHLLTHSTFQFYFLNNSLFTASLPYLRINQNHEIEIDWKIRATPSGTYVFFRSGHIFFKWKIEVRQGIVNMNLVKVAIEGASKFISSVKKTMGKFFGIDGSDKDTASKYLAESLVGKDRGSDFMEREKINRIQEQHTARMFQSTLSHTGDQAVEPAIFYANTVKFPYNLFDYWLRNEKNPFICRVYYSNNLLNNLIHNNNANQITYPLNITFEKLAQILKPGFIKGRLDSDHDPNNRMSECFARGVTFYDDKKNFFVKPNLGVKGIVTQIQYSATGGDSYTAQAITEGGDGLTIDIPYTADQRGYSHTTFFFLAQDQNGNSVVGTACASLRDAIVAGCGANPGNLHYSPTHGFCWGCTYDELKRVGFVSIKWTATVNCCAYVKLDRDGTLNDNFYPQAGVEYTVTITEDQFIFKSESTTKITWQKQPTQDDFSALDWSPPAGSGGEIEIPLEDPEIAIPEPGENDFVPEDDFTPDPYDISGGEVEIPPIEPDLPFDIDPGLDVDNTQDIDPPPIDVDPPQDVDTGQDTDPPQDIDRGEVDPPNEPDPNDDDAD